MAITQQDIDHIDRAIARGERVVRFADRQVEFRSMDELIKARNAMLTELSRAANPGRSRITRIYHAGKGF
ncbi:hypothetical protein D5039_00110 [Verminephrobacter aporrectodeae subsp. tuberculatae]|uniref:GpW protein n=1 Tax=Verminephrobacter aporrectodeae subsp. tuberculatae TaxID=1110392 RepID=A0ABT3KMU4_9BURK|nr:hypothetical protein [Verminephrobacter aporrectodeae]MCW5319638.1 hypothetical protein [Verminephrobacter aporrectodeae subsp. tuberculatae]